MAKKKKQPKNKKDMLWVEAKRRCRLNNEDIRMAKEMGLNPRSLIKNIPSKSELWKSPVKDWIHEMYQKRQEKAAKKKARKKQAAVACPATDTKQLLEDNTTYLDEEAPIFSDQDDPPDSQEVEKDNQVTLRRQEQFRIAAQYVADSLSDIAYVQKVVLFGSVAKPLGKEVPRFRKFQ